MLASWDVLADLEGSHRDARGNGARRPKAGGFLVRRAPWQAVGSSLPSIAPSSGGSIVTRLFKIDNGGTL